jgi:hypothetical protein
LVAISYPNFPRALDSARQHQAATTELAAAVRSFADRIQNCGLGAAGDVVVERPSGLTATMRVELPDTAAAA